MSDDNHDPFRSTRPMIQAILSGGGKKTPYLEEYLAEAGTLPNYVVQNLAIGCFGAVGGLIGLIVEVGAVKPGNLNAGIQFLVVYGVLWAGLAWLVSRLRRPRTARDRRELAVRGAAHALRPTVRKRRLAKDLGSATATLLEEAAQLRHRALSTLDGPFWTDSMLPAHWQSVRGQAIDAIEDAMGDLVLLAEPCLRPDPGKADWQELVGGFLGVEEPKDDELLPPMFWTARQIVVKLQELAAQVEQATRQVISEKPAGDVGQSSAALDACLSELRSIQQAETELRQTQGN